MTPPKLLIVNADDLAIHPAVNRAVFRAHLEGIVRSTTILVGGPAFEAAVKETKQLPELGVGIHLCLVEMRPVALLDAIPSLIDRSQHLPPSYGVFIKKYFSGRIRLEHIARELEAQIQRALDYGLKPTHLDSHQHLHILPGISTLVAELAKKYGIMRIRIPAEDTPIPSVKAGFVRRIQQKLVYKLAQHQRRQYQRAGLWGADHFVGFNCGGNFHLEHWKSLLPVLKGGVTEIMVHPGDDNRALEAEIGSGYHWTEELDALINPGVKSFLLENQVKLIHFGELP
ncbi:MAG: ChbG/HpnK family deacetylase [bacterium]